MCALHAVKYEGDNCIFPLILNVFVLLLPKKYLILFVCLLALTSKKKIQHIYIYMSNIMSKVRNRIKIRFA